MKQCLTERAIVAWNFTVRARLFKHISTNSANLFIFYVPFPDANSLPVFDVYFHFPAGLEFRRNFGKSRLKMRIKKTPFLLLFAFVLLYCVYIKFHIKSCEEHSLADVKAYVLCKKSIWLQGQKLQNLAATETPDYLLRPSIHPVKLDEILFLYSTTRPKLGKLIRYMKLWTLDSYYKIRCVITIDAKDSRGIEWAENQLRTMGHSCDFISYAQKFGILDQKLYMRRWFDSIKYVSFEGDETIKWVVYADDDTFFFLPNLLSLVARYNPELDWYLGTISERVFKASRLGHGGAGIILSRSTALKLQQNIEHALNVYRSVFEGDLLLGLALSDLLKINLTLIPDLHQVDLRGDINGFLESNEIRSTVISLHHISNLCR